MKTRRVFFNAISTVGQLIVNAIILFFLYRFLIGTLGIERLGVWSLLLATTSLVTLANQGLSMSIVKFVARYVGRESRQDVALLLQTALISAATLLAVLSIALYPASRWALSQFLPADRLAEALAILPLALISLWLNVLNTIAQAGLTGQELIAVCNSIEAAGSLSYLGLALLTVPHYGLRGLAFAQVIQAALGVVAAWWLLRRTVPGLPPMPLRWSRAHFREILVYGLHFQTIAFFQSLREPVTKALLAKFAGLAYTGYYDMASRLVVNVRELIVQANQALVPTISQLHETNRAAIARIYRDSYRLVFFLAVPLLTLIVLAAPLFSAIWLGHYEAMFVRFVGILALGWLANILCNPAYVVDLGVGSLRWVSVGISTTAVLNLGLGFAAGKWMGPSAIVAAGAISLAAGYIMILIAYHVENRESFRMLVPPESLKLLGLSAAAAIVCAFAAFPPNSLAPASSRVSALLAILFGLSMLALVWQHPIRLRLFAWVSNGMAA